jgi:HAD superfamily hydrolase (TIGR01450 family)
MTERSVEPESGILTAPPPRLKAYIFDLDGTVYLDDHAIPGAAETIAALRDSGAHVRFVTNNPLHPADEYARRLNELGIPTPAQEIRTSIDALISYLDGHHRDQRVMAIAEDEVIRRLTAAGYEVTDVPERTELVVVSFDRTFSYAKLHAAYRAVRERSAPIVATNPDPYCPTRDGGLPDCAAMLAALEACTGATAEAVVGKPSEHMIMAVLDEIGVAPSDAAMIGDRVLTDVAMGQAVGALGILVLTGATRSADLHGLERQPDYVLESINTLNPNRPKDLAR